jgi:hypothetical protein
VVDPAAAADLEAGADPGGTRVRGTRIVAAVPDPAAAAPVIVSADPEKPGTGGNAHRFINGCGRILAHDDFAGCRRADGLLVDDRGRANGHDATRGEGEEIDYGTRASD